MQECVPFFLLLHSSITLLNIQYTVCSIQYFVNYSKISSCVSFVIAPSSCKSFFFAPVPPA